MALSTAGDSVVDLKDGTEDVDGGGVGVLYFGDGGFTTSLDDGGAGRQVKTSETQKSVSSKLVGAILVLVPFL